jgi:hypothetical protein
MTRDWPSTIGPGDDLYLIVQQRGQPPAVSYAGSSMELVWPAWWHRVIQWLSPWRVRTYLFVRPGRH